MEIGRIDGWSIIDKLDGYERYGYERWPLDKMEWWWSSVSDKAVMHLSKIDRWVGLLEMDRLERCIREVALR